MLAMIILLRTTIYDWILENRSKLHIWYFEKYQFEIFIYLFDYCVAKPPHGVRHTDMLQTKIIIIGYYIN